MDHSDSELNKAIKFFPSSTNESVKREDYPQLGNNNADRLASIVRVGSSSLSGLSSLANLVPYGSILSELITNLIPSQRIERLEKYVTLLHKELDELRVENIQEKLKRPENISLFEDGAHQAVRALSDERMRYIVNCVVNGIASEDINKVRQKRVFSLLSQLDDEQILILYKTYNRSKRYATEVHKGRFNRRNKEFVSNEASRRIGIHLLQNLGLIITPLDNTVLSNLDYLIEPENLKITDAGSMLIRTIGLNKMETDET